MGDGYCVHHLNDNEPLNVGISFLMIVFRTMRRGGLKKIKSMLEEDYEGSCDRCGGEASRKLLDLVEDEIKRRMNIREYAIEFTQTLQGCIKLLAESRQEAINDAKELLKIMPDEDFEELIHDADIVIEGDAHVPTPHLPRHG